MKYSASQKHLYVIGDFNIDLLKFETCDFSQRFLISLQSCCLFPTIDKPTRVHRNSATLIDNIFSNNPRLGTLSGNIVSDISDHFTQFCITPSGKDIQHITSKKIRHCTVHSQNQFIHELSKTDMNPAIENSNDVDYLFSSWYRKLNDVVNKVAPLKPVSRKKVKNFIEKPWITQGIRKSIKVKNRLLFCGQKERYRFYRNKISTLIRISKRSYYENYFKINSKNNKKTWSAINELLSRKKSNSKSITSLKDQHQNNRSIRDPCRLPNIMNEHFSNVGKNLADKIPQTNVSFTDFLVEIDQRDSFFVTPVSYEEIEQQIMALSCNKTYGLYSCPIELLKAAKHTISYHLAKLFNLSVLTGKYPAKLKISKVVPVYKSDDESDPSNYRPISLLSAFNKIFEKLMYDRMIDFIDKNTILCDEQYGFRKGNSTSHAILDILSSIQSNLDKKLFTCAFFIDLSKAFDTVDHNILLKKLYRYGIRGVPYKWFESYLTDRTQTTSINNYDSCKKHIPCGVPQGSVLGPLLFLLYINDITYCSKLLKFHLFADDCNLLYANKCQKTLETTVNKELENLQIWLAANKLTLNSKKSNFVIFCSSRKKLNLNICLKIFDNNSGEKTNLERKKYVKYLGLLIDENLSWKHHIDFLGAKISRTIGLLSKLRYFLPTSTLLQIYSSLVEPYLTYGISAWGQANVTSLNTLLKLQKRALRHIFFKKHYESAVPLFMQSSLLPVNFLYIESIALLMFDVYHERAPPNIRNLFTPTDEIHSYNTRFANSKSFYHKPSRLQTQHLSFSRFGVRLWNQIPAQIKDLSKKCFKVELRQCLFELFESEGYFGNIANLKLFKSN